MKLVWTKNNRRQTLKIHHWLFGRRRWIKHDFISRPEGREAKGMCFLKDWMLKNRCKQLNQEKKRRCKPIRFAAVWRRHPDLNWGIRELQSHALPLGYSAILERVTRLELATSTLARWRSTRWAKPAYGAFGRNRTNDTRIFSPLLYQLSYKGICSAQQESDGQKENGDLDGVRTHDL